MLVLFLTCCKEFAMIFHLGGCTTKPGREMWSPWVKKQLCLFIFHCAGILFLLIWVSSPESLILSTSNLQVPKFKIWSVLENHGVFLRVLVPFCPNWLNWFLLLTTFDSSICLCWPQKNDSSNMFPICFKMRQFLFCSVKGTVSLFFGIILRQKIIWAMKTNPGCLGCIGDDTTQFYWGF